MKRVFFLLVVLAILTYAAVVRANQPTIVISEIQAAEVSDLEWIEVVNIGDVPVNMAGWTLYEDNTNHRLTLFQGTSTIAAGAYAIIAQDAAALASSTSLGSTTIFDSSWGSLKETGEFIALTNSEGEVVESFSYVTSTDTSLERINLDVQDYSAENWRPHPDNHSIGKENHWATVTSTPQQEDPLDIAEEDDVISSSAQNISISFSEIFPNPSDGEEWIELYNSGTSTATLTNWELSDGAGVLTTLSIDIPPSRYYVVRLPHAKLNNGGDAIRLISDKGILIDDVAYGNWEGAHAPVPKKDESLILVDGVWTITASSTPGEKNIQSQDDNELLEETGEVQEPQAEVDKAQLYINEIVSDPTDDAEEFIELYYGGPEAVSLNGYSVEDGAETKTSIHDDIEANGYLVLLSPKGKLNNAGDQIRLLGPAGSLIDSLSYGNWDDGNTADNAVVAKDPFSLSRISRSGNNFNDFVVTSEVTPGQKNDITFLEIDDGTEEQKDIFSTADIRISEVLPNPTGSDTDDEFIELYNAGLGAVSLHGWKLGDASKKRYTFDTEEIAPQSYLLLFRHQTGIALNNSGTEEVRLFDPSGALHHSISYSGSVPESQSYIVSNNDWAWTELPTPGKENVLEKTVVPPTISTAVPMEIQLKQSLQLDASDSSSANNETLSFHWDMGDGTTYDVSTVSHIYTSPGSYTISLRVADETNNSSSAQYPIHVFEPTGIIDTDITSETSSWQYLQLSELVPNPKGSDDAEYIELYNAGLQPLSLLGLLIDDMDGGSKPYALPDISIPALGYYIVHRKDSGIALNNSGDSVRFLSIDGKVLYELVYEGSIEGAAYVPDELGNWMWSMSPSPGSINILDEADVQVASVKKKKTISTIIDTTIAGARQQDSGDQVRVYGVVSVLPGILGSQYFYIAHEGAGIQVYMYSKDFPLLEVGQGIVVTGEVATSQGDVRLKIKDASDIYQQDQPMIESSMLSQIPELTQHLGDLVSVQGEVTEIKSSYFYIDDGNDEVKVYLKKGTGIEKKSIQVGDLVTITGIVIQTTSEIRLLPRNKHDIEVTGVATIAATERKAQAKENDREVAEKYLTATAGGITSLLFGLIAKVHAGTLLEKLRKRFFLKKKEETIA